MYTKEFSIGLIHYFEVDKIIFDIDPPEFEMVYDDIYTVKVRYGNKMSKTDKNRFSVLFKIEADEDCPAKIIDQAIKDTEKNLSNWFYRKTQRANEIVALIKMSGVKIGQ